MEPMEVIDLFSSDDEKSPPKKQAAATVSNARRREDTKNVVKSVDQEDLKIVYNAAKNQKRHAIPEENVINSQIKKIKLSEAKDDAKIVSNLLSEKKEITLHKVTRIKPETLSPQCTSKLFKSDKHDKNNHHSSSSTRTNGNNTNSPKNGAQSKDKQKSQNSGKNTQSFKINEGASSSNQFAKPQLTVKDIVKISESENTNSAPSALMIESFIDACRNQESSKDMETIISKLKRKYKNLEPSYAKSGQFMQLLRRKTDLVTKNCSKLYLHICEVMDEMKARAMRNRPLVEGSNRQDTTESGPSAQSELSDIVEEEKLDEDESVVENPRDFERLRALENAMKRCVRYINKCEMAEVNFDDEHDSHYIMAEKYKYRMVALYNKYCEITGERPDAARPYLRPKNLSVTPLQSLNSAITSFINMKITKMNKSLNNPKKKNAGQLRFTDALVFPDYIDILNCVKICNTEQNLELNKTRIESIAKNAFSDLGVHLQRCRQSDYYDTFSLYLEKEDCDPAITDKTLAEKLKSNQELGKKRLEQVFEDFVEKQNAAKASSENGSCLEKEENVETDDESSADSDDQHSETSGDAGINTELDSDSEEDETIDQNPPVQDDSDHTSNNDIEPVRPQCDLNQPNEHNDESDKLQDDFDQKGSKDELDQLPDDLNQKSDKDVEPEKLSVDSEKKCDESVEPDKLQGDLNESNEVIHEMDTDVTAEETTTENVESADGPDSISVQNTDDKSAEMDTNEAGESKIVEDEVQNEEKKGEEILSVEAALVQTENNENPIDQIKINEKTDNTAEPSETQKIAPLSSQILNPASTVARCEVNLLPTATNKMDGYSPRIAAIVKDHLEVIDAPAVATATKLIDEEEEKKPLLRVRQFAKPPGSWNDFESTSENTETNGTPDVRLEAIKLNKTLPAQGQASNVVKLINPVPVGRTLQITNRIHMNLKNPKSTVIIPANLNNSPPNIRVKTVTNHVTFNFNSQDQLQPKIGSAASNSLLKPAKKFVNISESGRIVTRCNNTGVITIGPERGKIPNNSNITRTVDILPNTIEQGTRVHLGGKQNTVSTPQQRFKIVPSKSVAGTEGKIVRHIPIIVDRGKKIFRIVDRSPVGKGQNIMIPRTTAGVQNQNSNCKSSAVANPEFKLKVSNSIRQNLPLKVTHQTFTKVNEVHKAPADSVPTILIE